MTQLNLFAAKKKRDEGIAKVANKNTFVLSLLRIQAKQLSRLNGSVSSDCLRKYADAEGLTVTDRNAWGAMCLSIFREKGWVECGRKQSEIEGNHARKINCYKWMP